MKRTALNSPLNMALVIALGVSTVGLSACSSEKKGTESGKVMAVDRVDDAAELARKNGPEAEDMAFQETAPVATADTATTATDVDAETGDVEVDGTANADEETAAADMPKAADSTAADEPTADSVENTNADKTAADGLQ